MPVTAETLELLIEAGVTNERLLQIVRSIERSEHVTERVREQSVTPDAVRMRKMRENKRKTAEQASEHVTERVTNEEGVRDIEHSNNPISTDTTVDNLSLPQTNKRTNSVTPYPTLFEHVWAEFPRKVGKDDAFRAWKKIQPRVSHETLLEAVKAHAKQMLGKEKQFIPHPATWLNDGRWQDEDLQPSKPPVVNGNGRIYAKYGTPEWDELEPKYVEKHGKHPPRDQAGGWWFETMRRTA